MQNQKWLAKSAHNTNALRQTESSKSVIKFKTTCFSQNRIQQINYAVSLTILE